MNPLKDEKPYRPKALAFVNRVGTQLSHLGVSERSVDDAELLRAAQRRTGLHDFGGDAFREPLAILCDSIEREANLHTVGKLITKTRLLSALCVRLRVQAYIARHPDALTAELPPPIVIAGLQRTGTTMLHRLLASDPSLRALLSWEAIAPVPGISEKLGMSSRVWQAKLSEQALRYMAPGFFAIHPVEALAPEEDVLLLDYAFMSTTPEATMTVPSYAYWLENHDNLPAYDYLVRLLKVLAHQRGPRRWVLKTPHHLEFLDLVLDVFPGARVVQTHRDPARTLASFCSMMWHGRGVFSDHVDAEDVGRTWLKKTVRMLDRAMAVREARRDEGFVDVSYYDLIASPLDTVRTLYEALELPFDGEVEARMQRTREHNPQHKYGTHRYALSDFGLDVGEVERAYGRYRARFGIPHEE